MGQQVDESGQIYDDGKVRPKFWARDRQETGKIEMTNIWGGRIERFKPGERVEMLAFPPYFKRLDGSERPKRTRRGLKVPAYLVMMSDIHKGFKRSVVISTHTYGRNGDWRLSEMALDEAKRAAQRLPGCKPWIEQGFVVRRLPQKRIHAGG